MPASATSRVRRSTLRGCETPRIFTPPLRELTPETSLGFHVIAFAEKVLLLKLHPWQKWLLIHALELREDNTLRFRTVVVLVGRQNGKSLVSQVLALWAMYVYGLAVVLGTAQDLDTAEDVWQGAVDLVEEVDEDDDPVRPELLERLEKVVQVNGKKALVVNRAPGMPGVKRRRYKVKSANRRAGRGLSGDLILLDELREHQTWDAWGSLTKTTMARALALVLCLSNAGDATSVVLRHLRRMAHAALDDPDDLLADEPELTPVDSDSGELLDELDDDTLGIFEWSAPPGCAKTDRNAWAQANPSMNHPNGVAESTIASACHTDPDWIFRTEVLCQWTTTAIDGPFPDGSWTATADEESKVATGERIVLGIDTSWDRQTTHVGMAGMRDDGVPHIGVIATRAGTDWVSGWLDSDAAPPFDAIVVQGKGAPASALIADLREAGHDVVEWGGADLGLACGDLYDRVRAAVGEGNADGTLRHRSQPLLDIAAATAATKPSGDVFVWDRRKSPTDVAPLIAVTEALWGLLRASAPTTSAYEDADLLVI